MMKDFIVDLVEQTDARYFSIDSGDEKEYLFKKRTGLLQRTIGNDRVGKSLELHSPTEAGKPVAGKISAAALKIPAKDIPFNPSKILRDNAYILDTLRQVKAAEWKIIVRANHTGRIIIKKESKEKKTAFTYFSILIKLRLKDRPGVIEVGEGSVQGLKFNQDGLGSRIKKIVENHRNSKFHGFAGKVPVILNAGDGAIVFHEILGHSLEADHIYREQSPISTADIGKPIVSQNVTLVTKYNHDSFFKDMPCDDEGETAASSTLVENGILRNLIADSFYKERLGLENCGHARVEDFTKMPMPRMYALYLKPGHYHPEELIASTKYGVYAVEFGEGKVYFERNLFHFNIRGAWLIKNGKLSSPLGSIVVQGNIIEVLNSVAMVADDFHFDRGISYCFKNGQTVNVRVGQPTVKIDNLYVSPGNGVR